MKIAQFRLSLSLTLATCASLAASELPALKDAFDRSGDNRAELERFVADSQDAHGEFGKRAAEFLIVGMPESDLQSLDAAFLNENLHYAFQAREEFPWAANVPEEIFFNDVLPYASLDETREQWRPDFYDRAAPLVRDAQTATEATQILNREFFNQINVHYNTGRKRPNQSPSESIAQSRATCTGLSIILVDVCRAVGVPARVAGTPLWTNKRGNHTWTEIWDGEWLFTGADEYDAKGLNRGWFVGDASKAIPGHPLHAIYASSWRSSETHFPMVWARNSQEVGAVDVTARYLKDKDAQPKEQLFVRVRESQGGDRVEVNAELLDEELNVLASKKTKAGRADLNDIAGFYCDPNRPLWLRLSEGDVSKPLAILRSSAEPLTLDAAWDELPTQEEIEQSQLAGLTSYLATPASARPDSIPANFASGDLSEADAELALQRLWEERKKRLKEQRSKELEERSITLGDKTLKYLVKEFGDAPQGQRSLWISMHGGGNAPARVNDRQWQNQIGLYELEEGIYIAPRAPTDTWNLWHEGHIDPLFDRLIENHVLYKGVDPNRVYILGYSAGGDGVYQLAPRFADRLAAACMMAGHPNEAQPDNLLNIGFGLFMGGDDSAYNRNTVAKEWADKLDELGAKYPEGYQRFTRIYPGLGHWMNGKDAEGLPWMAELTRDPWPSHVIWRQDDITHSRFYWIAVNDESLQAGQRIEGKVDAQTVHLTTDNYQSIQLRLSDHLLDLDQPITVKVNGETQFEGVVNRSILAIKSSLDERADPASAATATLDIEL